MLPGFGGHLISEAFLEEALRTIDGDGRHAAERFRGDLIQWRRRCAVLGPASSVRTVLHVGATPLFVALGFDAPIQIEPMDHHLAATVSHASHRTTLIVTAWAEPLDHFWRLAVMQAIRRATDWCFVFNGIRLRIVDARRLYARRFVEFDLDLAQDDERSCAALFRIASAAALIDRSDSRSLHAIVSASDRHAAGVCRSLKDGVLSASADLLGALVARPPLGEGGIGDSFEQALTIVYRMLFLLFAEARSLVPLWHPVYRHSYSVEALRGCAEIAEPASGLWDALHPVDEDGCG